MRFQGSKYFINYIIFFSYFHNNGFDTCVEIIGQEITGGMGVDTCVEALGNPKTFMQCVQSVRDGGKAVMIGLTLSGAKGEIDINHLVRRQVCFNNIIIYIYFLFLLKYTNINYYYYKKNR